MKKTLLFIIAAFFISPSISAQTTRNLKNVLELKMPKNTGDDYAGANGAAVVWHSLQKKYYAAMAGNQNFPIAIFNATGKRLSSENATTLIDLRGMWYNTKTKKLCGNGYGENGWFEYTMDPKGAVLDIEIKSKEMAQPTEQSVGTYYTPDNKVLFLDGNTASLYDADAVVSSHINLRLGLTSKEDIGEPFELNYETPQAYNYTTIVYTGIKNAELGMLNIEKNQIELYSFTDGFLSTLLKLPDETNTYSSFNFSFSNGFYWLFNKDSRTWTGYK